MPARISGVGGVPSKVTWPLMTPSKVSALKAILLPGLAAPPLVVLTLPPSVVVAAPPSFFLRSARDMSPSVFSSPRLPQPDVRPTSRIAGARSRIASMENRCIGDCLLRSVWGGRCGGRTGMPVLRDKQLAPRLLLGRDVFEIAEVLRLAGVDGDRLAGAAGGAAEKAAAAVPDDHAAFACRRVLDLEIAVLVRHGEVRVVEHADPAVHPWVDIALHLDGEAICLEILDGHLAVGRHEEVLARIEFGMAGIAE